MLRPCILWNDGRSATEAAELDADPRFREITGNIVFPGFTAPKLRLGAASTSRDVFDKVAKVLLPKDYVRLWLTGDARLGHVGFGRHVLARCRRSATGPIRLLAATDLDRAQMPTLVEGTEPSRQAARRARLALGHGRSAPVVAGGAGDNAASACGIGTVAPGAAFVSLGTSGVLFVSNDSFRPTRQSAVHAFCHALPDTWHQMGVILSATDRSNGCRDVTGQRRRRADRRTRRRSCTAPGGVCFLPYLSGERTPHNDAAHPRRVHRAWPRDRPRAR